MKRFEYIKTRDPNEDELDELGKDGWELVACGSIHDGNTHNVYLKREII
jgi:hypothetical protein